MSRSRKNKGFQNKNSVSSQEASVVLPKRSMTSPELIVELRKSYANVDASKIEEHFVIQFNIEGQAAGKLYVEFADGEINVQPHDHPNRNLLLYTDCGTAILIAEGKLSISAAVANKRLRAEGDVKTADKIYQSLDRKAMNGVQVHLQYAQLLIAAFGGDHQEEPWNEYRKLLEWVQLRQKDSKLNLSIIGEFTTGKSTFINGLLRRELLVSSILQGTTQASIIIEYGEAYQIYFEYLNGRPPYQQRFRRFEQLREVLNDETTTPEKAQQLKSVNVQMPADVLKNSFRIIDTPGTNVNEAWHEDVTVRTLNEYSDLSVILISAEKPAAETTIQFVKKNLESVISRCVFVVTKLDNLRPRERQRQLDYIKMKLEDSLELENAIVLPYVAPMVLASVDEGEYCDFKIDKGLLERSLSTEVTLVEHMQRQKTAVQTQKLVYLIDAIERDAPIEQFSPTMLNMMEKTKLYCPKCGKRLDKYQAVCSHCGKLHQMKVVDMSEETQKKLNTISRIVSRDAADYSICWDMEARRIAQALTKVTQLTEQVSLPGVTDSLKRDMESLIYRCAHPEFQIAIVGIMKAGKSMLMNSLIGEEIASTNINPETAALTKFRSGEGYSIKITLHTKEQWDKLYASAKEADAKITPEAKENMDLTLYDTMSLPEAQKMMAEWLGHDPVNIVCNSIEELRDNVYQWTSSHSMKHLFADEVEVCVDRNIFDMPEDVVFVDTPGLQDPVQYRSDITKEYIRKANAVLIALETRSMNAQMLQTTTMALDFVGTKTEKAYIIGTQKDRLNDPRAEREIVKNWMENLIAAGRFKEKKQAENHIITTSAYMSLLLNRLLHLSEDIIKDKERFNHAIPKIDRMNLVHFAQTVLDDEECTAKQLYRDHADAKAVNDATGILQLHELLQTTLLSKYHEYMMSEIKEEYLRCRSEMLNISHKVGYSQNTILSSARQGGEVLRQRMAQSNQELEQAKVKNKEIREVAAVLKRITQERMSEL